MSRSTPVVDPTGSVPAPPGGTAVSGKGGASGYGTPQTPVVLPGYAGGPNLVKPAGHVVDERPIPGAPAYPPGVPAPIVHG